MDKQVDAIKEHIPLLQVNAIPARGHMEEIEQEIHTTKERTRCTPGESPFWIIPTMVLIYTMYNMAL